MAGINGRDLDSNDSMDLDSGDLMMTFTQIHRNNSFIFYRQEPLFPEFGFTHKRTTLKHLDTTFYEISYLLHILLKSS